MRRGTLILSIVVGLGIVGALAGGDESSGGQDEQQAQTQEAATDDAEPAEEASSAPTRAPTLEEKSRCAEIASNGYVLDPELFMQSASEEGKASYAMCLRAGANDE